MLREAAVLGVPALSCFAGPLGAVDRWLADEGRVTLVRSADDLANLHLARRANEPLPERNGGVLKQIVQGICEAADGV
jgi:predicted glycosyltransferase